MSLLGTTEPSWHVKRLVQPPLWFEAGQGQGRPLPSASPLGTSTAETLRGRRQPVRMKFWQCLSGAKRCSKPMKTKHGGYEDLAVNPLGQELIGLEIGASR